MASNISFASFNLYNLQEVGKRVYRTLVTRRAYEPKVKWTRDKLVELDADVIAFQELWARSCLEEVFRDDRLSGYQLVYIKDRPGDTWGNIAVAMAVRSPLVVTAVRRFKKFPFSNITQIDDPEVGEDHEVDLNITRFSRTVLKVTIKANNDPQPIDVYAAHFKAKLPSNRQAKDIVPKHRNAIATAISTIRRTAEAAALRWIVTNAMTRDRRPTVVIGDLNDDPRSNTLTILTEQPNLSKQVDASETALYSCLQFEQLKSHRDVLYTHEYNNLKDSLDHILVSSEFFEHADGSIWRHGSTRVWNDFVEDDLAHTSDHGIIRAEFTRLN